MSSNSTKAGTTMNIDKMMLIDLHSSGRVASTNGSSKFDVPVYVKAVKGFVTKLNFPHKLRKEMFLTYNPGTEVPNYVMVGEGAISVCGKTHKYTKQDSVSLKQAYARYTGTNCKPTGIIVVTCLPRAKVSSGTKKIRTLLDPNKKKAIADYKKMQDSVNKRKWRPDMWTILAEGKETLASKRLKSRVAYQHKFGVDPRFDDIFQYVAMYRYVRKYTNPFGGLVVGPQEKFFVKVFDFAKTRPVTTLNKFSLSDISTPEKFAAVLNKVLSKKGGITKKDIDKFVELYNSGNNNKINKENKMKLAVLVAAHNPSRVTIKGDIITLK